MKFQRNIKLRDLDDINAYGPHAFPGFDANLMVD